MAFSFNSEKDRLIHKFKQKTWGLTCLRLTLHSYDSGPPKVQIHRLRRYSEDDDFMFAKLGRLDYDEARWLAKQLRKEVVPYFQEHMSDRKGGDSSKGKQKGKQRKKDRG